MIRDVTILVCLSFKFAEIFFFLRNKKKALIWRFGCHDETKLTHTRRHTHKFTSQFNIFSKDEIFLVWFMSVVVVVVVVLFSWKQDKQKIKRRCLMMKTSVTSEN